MKITEIKLFYINPGIRTSFGTGWSANYLLIKIFTDEGIYGVGEAFRTGKDKATEGALAEYARWFVGKDPTRVLHNWYAIFRGARYPLGTATTAALSAVEHALWDISAKALGVPVHRMLGGAFRDRIRVYGSTYLIHPENFEKGDLAPFAAGCRVAKEKGFSAIKITPQPPNWQELTTLETIKGSVERVRAAREAVGDDVDIGLDYHGRELSPTVAIQLAKQLEEFDPFFLEEPALSETPDSLAEIKSKTTIPIAAGERIISRDRLREILEKRAIHIFQPEPAANGGIYETVKWAAMAELYHILVAPHHACSPVSLMANIQIDSVIPNFLIQECHVELDSELIRRVFIDPPVVVDGSIEVPDKPGLGIDFDEKAATEFAYKPYDRPIIIRRDGSIGLE